MHNLFLTKKPLKFRTTLVIKKGRADRHKMILAVMKLHFTRMKPQFIKYYKYQAFHNGTFFSS